MRYIILIILALQIAVFSEKIPLELILFILFIVINNQLRVFYFNNKYLIYVSVITEFIVCTAMFYLYRGITIAYFLPLIMDAFLMIDGILKYIAIVTLFITITIFSVDISVNEILTNLCFLSTIYILFMYIIEENRKKEDAQFLYDKLRISEENLKKANVSLENYAESIEELTTLRERNRISREIHDSVGHALSTTMIQLKAMEMVAKKEGSSLDEMASNLREFVNDSFQDVRRAVRDLKPIDYKNYEEILRVEELSKNFTKLTGIEVKLNLSKYLWSLSSKQGANIYRIAQEFLSNASRHGKANKVDIFMNFNQDTLIMTFRDNGIGCNNINSGGIGIKNMHERALELKGTIDITTALNKGFSMKLVIPRERSI